MLLTCLLIMQLVECGHRLALACEKAPTTDPVIEKVSWGCGD